MKALYKKLKSFAKAKPKTSLILALIVALFLYVGVYKPIEALIDKQRFVRAEKTAKELQSQIEAATGEASNVDIENRCGYSGAKFSKGTLKCGTVAVTRYENLSPQEASAILQKTTDRFDVSFYYSGPKEMKNEDIAFMDDADFSETYTQILEYENHPDCNIIYEYPSRNPVKNHSYDNTLEIYLSCYGEAKSEHYPVRE